MYRYIITSIDLSIYRSIYLSNIPGGRSGSLGPAEVFVHRISLVDADALEQGEAACCVRPARAELTKNTKMLKIMLILILLSTISSISTFIPFRSDAGSRTPPRTPKAESRKPKAGRAEAGRAAAAPNGHRRTRGESLERRDRRRGPPLPELDISGA